MLLLLVLILLLLKLLLSYLLIFKGFILEVNSFFNCKFYFY